MSKSLKRCDADWDSATSSQRCTLRDGHDGTHIDGDGRWSPAEEQTSARVSSGPGVVPSLVAVAIHLVEDAFFLRCNGERPPGAPPDSRAETWADWDRRAEDFLRREVF